jgi:thiamine biosynthesis lipoprotein
MERVGWRRLIVDSGQRTIRFQRDGMGLDFGGVGKGIALDRAAKILKDRGVRRALFNFGGELLAFGDRGAWSAQIADPEDRDRAVVNLFVREAAVSTSSQSERGVTVGAHRYGHTLDPRTGHPVETVASVTVVTKSGARADALSTALLVMGREAAEAFLEDRTDVGALWIEREGGELKVWRWRLPSASAIAGVPLKWMN